MALAAVDVPTEFVSVAETDAMVFTLPPMVKGMVRENCEPMASELEFPYQDVNMELTSTVNDVVCKVAPEAGVNWNVAVFMSRVVDSPSINSWMPPLIWVTTMLLITGAAARIWVVKAGAGDGVTSTPASMNVRPTWIVPATVPAMNVKLYWVVFGGIVNSMVCSPLANRRSVVAPTLGVNCSTALSMIGNVEALARVMLTAGWSLGLTEAGRPPAVAIRVGAAMWS